MTTPTADGTRKRANLTLPAVSVAIGVGYLVVGLLGDNAGFGLFGLGIMTALAVGILAFRGRSETVEALMDRRDERINSFDLKATAVSGIAMGAAVIVAFMVEIARGHDGMPFTWIGALGGVAYLGALIVLRVRG